FVVVRVLWRMAETRPEPPQGARWMKVTRKAVEWALYVLLFAVPVTAIAGAWLEGHPLTLLAGLAIPPLPMLTPNARLSIASHHTWLGDLIIWIGGFHALADLYHHFVVKDTALISMLPRWLPVRQRSSLGAKSAR